MELYRFDAGWSSLAARRAHNPKVVGSNPAPATNFLDIGFDQDLVGLSLRLISRFSQNRAEMRFLRVGHGPIFCM